MKEERREKERKKEGRKEGRKERDMIRKDRGNPKTGSSKRTRIFASLFFLYPWGFPPETKKAISRLRLEAVGRHGVEGAWRRRRCGAVGRQLNPFEGCNGIPFNLAPGVADRPDPHIVVKRVPLKKKERRKENHNEEKGRGDEEKI
jgi:hypothetical protein